MTARPHEIARHGKAILGAVAKIAPVTSMIAEIATQTNPFALNARTETALAGKAGKGFAVIAT